MHGLLAHLTAAFLVAHTLLGCCWHHVHSCGHTHGLVALVGWQHSADLRCGHARGGPERPGDHDPGRDECKGNKCDLIVSAKEKAAASFLTARQPAGRPVSAADHAPPAGPLEPRLWPTSPLLPGVRLHLVNQVLLI